MAAGLKKRRRRRRRRCRSGQAGRGDPHAATGCSLHPGRDAGGGGGSRALGMPAKCVLSAGMFLLLLRCSLAAEGKNTYDASGSPSSDLAAPAHPSADQSSTQRVTSAVLYSDGGSASEGEGLSGQPAFSSVLTVMAGTVKHPESLAHNRTSTPLSSDNTTQWPSHSSSQGSETASSSSSLGGNRTQQGSSSAETVKLTAATSGVSEPAVHKESRLNLSQSVAMIPLPGPTERTSQVSPLTAQQDTTTASLKLTTTTTTTVTSSTTTSKPHSSTPSQSTTVTTRKTATTATMRAPTSRRLFPPPVLRTSPPRGTTTVFISPFTTTTEAPPQQCNITERMWVRTVVSIYVRRNRLDSIQRQNLRRGLSQGLRKALNDSSAQAQVETVFGSPNMTVAYHVTGKDMVYVPSVVLSGLDAYGRDKLIADLRQYLPMVTALPIPVAVWRTNPALGFQLKTVLQFVGATDDPRSCQFSQMMEQRLEKVFSEAQAKALNDNSKLSVQMLSVSQAAGSPAVSLVYSVKNGTVFLNGTTASNLLGQLSAELVGYFLFYPPLIVAEPLEYHNLNTSIATRDFWVITVIQDVDNDSLEGLHQSFASLMEQRLAELFVLAGQQGTRFRRATAVGSYTVQMAYRRDVNYYHQPVQGFDYAKQHLGQQGDEDPLPAGQDTLVMSLQIRDAPLSLEKTLKQEGTVTKTNLTSDKHKSKLLSEDGSVISSESEKRNSVRGFTAPKVTAQQKPTKEETRKRTDQYDSSSGSLQLISIKPMTAQPKYSQHVSSDRNHDSAMVNGEVNLALKQRSDIEHYRNKLRLKAKKKGYYDFPSIDGSSCGGRGLTQTERQGHGKAEPDEERNSTYVKSHIRRSQVGQTSYRSRQSLNTPSPGGTEMDLLVMRERPRKGIRNSGYDTEPELIEETNVDHLIDQRGFVYGRGLKGQSQTSTLSSQPSIDEVRHQMHLLLEEAFSLASGGQSTSGRHSHSHPRPSPDQYSAASLPYADVVTSAPGTMSGRSGLQWSPSYGTDVYQCSLPKPAFHFTQLPDMAISSPPPLPPRTGPPPGTSLRRSISDLGPKGRSSQTSVIEMQSPHDNNPYGPSSRAALPSITVQKPVSNYSGNPITAVYSIPASRTGYSDYYVSTSPTSYHSPSWMSYPPEPEDVPPQWADSLPLPGYVEAFPHPRYPQGSPSLLPLQYTQTLDQQPAVQSTTSQKILPQVGKDTDSVPLSNLSTSALVNAIRQEVAKLAKKQSEMFDF
ncbi:UPF0606 protein KIAA1549L isoform X4 [Nerophis lumbriciformis]|uniref:UPF0606 protein KIAA1549L isoform X4 n=1 Tax=Nerophis lumbriciformis TaxID=546530 RepID=UPI003BAB2FEE